MQQLSLFENDILEKESTINYDYGNLLDDLFSAYFDARKNKRWKVTPFRFEMNYENHIMELAKEIENRTYEPKFSIAFINKNPVLREVFAARFHDRVVNHFIFNHINPIFEKTFINDSYSCRKGKGTLYGINQAKTYLKQVTKNYTQQAYILKLDLKGYFYSINHDLLYEKIQRILLKNKQDLKVDYELIDFLIKKTIYTDHTKNAIRLDPKNEWKDLPKDKSLYNAKTGTGLPIGNLTSQLYSNIYLNDFDHYMKSELKLKYYGRYVDDFYIFHNDNDYLKSLIPKIRQRIANVEKMKIHPKKIYFQPHQRGMEFLGGYIKPEVTFIGKRTKKNFNALIFNINKHFNDTPKTEKYLFELRAKINSYLGLLSHYKTYKLRKHTLSKLCENFHAYFFFSYNLDKVILKGL